MGITIATTCAALASALASAQPGDVINLTSDCAALVDVRNRTFAAPGVTVNASGRNIKAGVRMWDMSGVSWQGGTVRGGSNGYGFDIRRGARISVEGATLTGAVRGIVVNATNGVTLRKNKFQGMRSDGINLVGKGNNALVESNVFRGSDPGATRCVVGGKTLTGISNAACEDQGGTWYDTYHPDAVQTWGYWGAMAIRDNDIQGDTQGINTFGAGPPSFMDISNNRINITFTHAISNAAKTGVVKGNVVTGYGNYQVQVTGSAGIVMCSNVLPQRSNHAATLPCPGTPAGGSPRPASVR